MDKKGQLYISILQDIPAAAHKSSSLSGVRNTQEAHSLIKDSSKDIIISDSVREVRPQ